MTAPAPAPSQVQHPGRATARTVFQLIVGLAAALPSLILLSGIPAATAGVGTALAVSALITRLMAMPAVEAALAMWVPWLSAEPAAGN